MLVSQASGEGFAGRAGSGRIRDQFFDGPRGTGLGKDWSMGLDVWVVKMEHVDSPKEPVRGFLDDLIREGFDDTWGGVVESNAYFEADEEDLERKAKAYAFDEKLSREDAEKVVSWVRNLPWEDGALSLNVNW